MTYSRLDSVGSQRKGAMAPSQEPGHNESSHFERRVAEVAGSPDEGFRGSCEENLALTWALLVYATRSATIRARGS